MELRNIEFEGYHVIFTDENGKTHKIKSKLNNQRFAYIQYKNRQIYFRMYSTDGNFSITPYVRDGDIVKSLYGNDSFELDKLNPHIFVRG